MADNKKNPKNFQGLKKANVLLLLVQGERKIEKVGVAIKRCTKLGNKANLLMKHKPQEADFYDFL